MMSVMRSLRNSSSVVVRLQDHVSQTSQRKPAKDNQNQCPPSSRGEAEAKKKEQKRSKGNRREQESNDSKNVDIVPASESQKTRKSKGAKKTTEKERTKQRMAQNQTEAQNDK